MQIKIKIMIFLAFISQALKNTKYNLNKVQRYKNNKHLSILILKKGFRTFVFSHLNLCLSISLFSNRGQVRALLLSLSFASKSRF